MKLGNQNKHWTNYINSLLGVERKETTCGHFRLDQVKCKTIVNAKLLPFITEQ